MMSPAALSVLGTRRFLVRVALLSGASWTGWGGAAVAQQATPPGRGLAETSAQGNVRLEELSVTGEGGGARAVSVPGVTREDPRGPIDGYVAKRTLSSTKTDTPLIETPQSISVIGRQQLDALNVQQVGEALTYSAGVYGNTFGPSAVADFFLIRGFTAQDTGLYRDGLQLLNLGFAGFRVDPFGLERIEVLRGPASVLYGQGGPGGLINLVSKKPTLEPLNYVEVGGGSFGQKYLAFDLGGPADKEGHWFTRLTGIGRQGGTQVDGLDQNVGYLAPTFTYKPDGATTLTFLSSVQYEDTGRINAFLPYFGTVRPQALGLRIPRNFNVNDTVNNVFRRTQASVGYEFEHVFDETWTFRQNLRYAYTETYDNSLGSGFGYVDPLQTLLGRARFRATSRAGVFNIDNQAVARFDDGLFGHTLLVGLDYKSARVNDNQAFGVGPVEPFNILAPNYGVPTVAAEPFNIFRSTLNQVGLYAQDQIKLTPELTLVASGRGDFTTTDDENRVAGTSTRQIANVGTQRYGLIYNFDFGLAPYVSYASFFNPQIGANLLGQLFQPVTGDQYEAGVKYQPPGFDAFLTLAAFDLTLNNTFSPDPANPFNQLQLGRTRSRGFEAQFVANLSRNWNVAAQFTTYNIDIVAGDVGIIGNRPTNTPETLASVFTDYTIPTGDWAGFGIGGGARYTGSSFADPANTLKVPERVLFDAVVHYNRDNWRFAVNLANLADKRFVAACQGENACFYGEARRITASVSTKW